MRLPSWDRFVAAALFAVAGGLFVWAIGIEFERSPLQSRLFSRLAAGMTYTVVPGESLTTRFPDAGPYNQRLGYARMPVFIEALKQQDFTIDRQAEISPTMRSFIDYGGFHIFPEKAQAGLAVLDRTGRDIYLTRHPERVFPSFEAIPPLIVETLLFVENRELLNTEFPTRNPAIEWDRFALASANVLSEKLHLGSTHFGGSTLATQIEKYRHSPEGRTGSIGDKLRRSPRRASGPTPTGRRRRRRASASSSTTSTRRRCRRGPAMARSSASATGFGPGTAPNCGELVRLLSKEARTPAEQAARAVVYKQALSLMLAQRRPSHYLLQGRDDLGELTDSHLRLLASEGVIDDELRDQALAAPLRLSQAAAAERRSLVPRPQGGECGARPSARPAADAATLRSRPHGPAGEFDPRPANPAGGDRYAEAPQRSRRRPEARADRRAPARPQERRRRRLQLHAVTSAAATPTIFASRRITLDRPLDLNEGGKLDLGSTAKLRTLTTYLRVIAELHATYAAMGAAELAQAAADVDDPLSRWAVNYLRSSADRSLQAMIDAAMAAEVFRQSGESFFTGSRHAHLRQLRPYPRWPGDGRSGRRSATRSTCCSSG